MNRAELRARVMKMNVKNILFLILPLISFVCLSACQSTGGASSYWRYFNAQKNTPAEQPPSALVQAEYTDNTIFETADMLPVESEPLAGPAQTPALAGGMAAPNGQTVKVGLLLPLSGQHEKLGQAMLQAAQMALFDMGYANFELLPEDTKGLPAGARQAAQSVLNQGASLILGPVFAESVRAVRPVAQGAGVNVIGFSTDWAIAGGNVFLMGFMPFDQIERITEYAALQGYQNIAVIAPDTEYGRAVVSAYQLVANTYGIVTTDIRRFSPDSKNLAPLMREFTHYDQRMAKARAEQGLTEEQAANISLLHYPPPFDAVMMPVGGDMALSISNLLSHYDLPPGTVKRLGTGLMDDTSLAGESSLRGSWFAAPSPALRESFESRFTEVYGYTPPRLSTLAYDAAALSAVLAKRGLQRQGRPDFDSFSLTNPNGFFGIDGIFRFRQNGTAERGLAILELRNRQINIVDEAPTTFENLGIRQTTQATQRF